jgi:hypothetical protein
MIDVTDLVENPGRFNQVYRARGDNQGHQADTGVTPEREIWKPLPSARQVMHVVADVQRNGPSPVAVP